MKTIPNLSVVSLRGKEITGDITCVADYPFIFTVEYISFVNTSVYGNINELVDKFRSKGHTEGSFNLRLCNTDVMFGQYKINSDVAWVLSWTADSYTYIGGNAIYAYNATDEQINEWTAAGNYIFII